MLCVHALIVAITCAMLTGLDTTAIMLCHLILSTVNKVQIAIDSIASYNIHNDFMR